MKYLALDTSTGQAGVAIISEGLVLAEDNWCSGKNHSVELLVHVEAMLDCLKIQLGQIQGIAVALGPGSYNGLRVGISAAKGLALGLGIPVAGISTLEASAYHYTGQPLPVCALQPTGRTEIACAVFATTAGNWQRVVPERIVKVEELSSVIFGTTLFCGEISDVLGKQIREQLGDTAVLVPETGTGRAADLARLCEKRLAAGDSDDAASLQPLYLHRPSITPPKSPIPGTAV